MNPPNPHFSNKCLVCNNPISNHSEDMINKCYDTIKGVLLK